MNGVRIHQKLLRVSEHAEVNANDGIDLIPYCIPAKSMNGGSIEGYVAEGMQNDEGTLAYLDLLALDGYTIRSEQYGWYAYKVRMIDPQHVVDTTIRIWLDLLEPLKPYPHIMSQCSFPLP